MTEVWNAYDLNRNQLRISSSRRKFLKDNFICVNVLVRHPGLAKFSNDGQQIKVSIWLLRVWAGGSALALENGQTAALREVEEAGFASRQYQTVGAGVLCRRPVPL